MKDRIEITALIEEIYRYLAAVADFRAAGCEPTWRAEPPTSTGREARCTR
jgi:hypothetical protein